MNRISQRQLFFFLAFIAPVGKLVLMPSQLVFLAKNDLLFPTAVNFFVQAAVIFCVLLLAKRNQSIYQMLANTFGKIAAKVIMCVFSLFLLYAALLPILEQRLFVQSVFYDTLPTFVPFAPFFLFSAYLCAKPLGACGRTWDILGLVSAIGFAGILILSVGSADYQNLLPVGAAGGGGFLRGTAFTLSWFFDSAILMLFLGKIDYKKGMAWKGALCYLAGAAILIFFLATFYGIFAETAINQPFAFSKTAKYFAGITVLGRIDYIFIFALALVMLFYTTLPIQACIESYVQAFGKQKYLPFGLAIALNAVLFGVSFFLRNQIETSVRAIADVMFWIFPIFCIVLPVLALLLRRNKKEESA